jgi:hypothetical protein
MTPPQSSMHPDRQALISILHRALAAHPWARAAWLAGSDANNRTDRFSDIDLVAAVDDDHVETAFATIKGALEGLSPIELEWRVPSPTWHGHEQVFYRLRDADPHLFIDFVVIKRSAPVHMRFLERERHGDPVVLFDRDAFIAAVPLDRPTHDVKMQSRLNRLRITFPLFQPLVTRAVERGQPTDAAYWYMQLTLLPTVEVLRMLRCPDRFDFGMRYLGDDLPGDVYAEVCKLALPGSLEAIRACRERAEVVFRRALATLDARSTSDA